ncbi:MAG: hypothetical protein DRN15_06010 [Thermoprotei archaeon]|nr:MAG: hypothetical protein DRN15_06010 [Thermoprotei archaeon]RLF25014.1 MAG: hypothetical protein DRM97_02615 [Thermoprotei archaeon]
MSRELDFIKVNDLTATSRRVNIKLKVVRVGKERRIISSFDGKAHRVAEALVGDETGVILMTLWDDKIDFIRDLEGKTIVLINGYVSTFRNSMRLNIGRYGKVEESDEEIEEVNEDNNLSERRVPSGWRSRRYGRFRR